MTTTLQRMGPYEIRREIGSGGMGVVYEGWDARLNRRVAVKTLWPALAQRPEARERFLREARAAASISHPNVTQIYDIGEEGGQVYFAMEYLEAKSLQEILEEQGCLSAERAIDIARQAARGLKAAAEAGIIHRDVKPSNLMFNNVGCPEGHRLRSGQASDGRPGPDARRSDHRHAEVRLARAGLGRARRCPQRHLLPGRDVVRDGGRQTTVRGFHADGGHAEARPRNPCRPCKRSTRPCRGNWRV